MIINCDKRGALGGIFRSGGFMPVFGWASGWRRNRGTPPLEEVFSTIAAPLRGPAWRRLLAFVGPGYLVAVGYMDPGNWATSLAGGSAFGYTLLSITLMSSLMAIVLQALCARLGIATGRDLAQSCRDAYSRPVAIALWALAEAAIVATDLAEVIGTAIALNLLFGIPIQIGVIVTALDVFLILALQNLGFRLIEAFVIALITVIAACFAVEMVLVKPEITGVLGGLVPSTEIVTNPEMLYIALGILGATVMPHNLYLHAAIVQTRRIEPDETSKRAAIRYASIDSTVALLLALFINGSILVLAAATFHKAGQFEVAEIQQAFRLLTPMLGTSLAAILFAIALLASGLNSTVTATLAGQIVMEGFLDIRLPRWLRRLITRALAIIPAAAIAFLYGEKGTAELLILSQVILSLQLPFAVVPLVLFTADRRKMGGLVAPLWLSFLAGTIAAIIIVLNIKLLWDVAAGG
jgi:manganese transport protein